MDGEGNELLLSDILGTDEDVIQRPMEDRVDMMVLRKAVNDLPDREREIILMRYGMYGRKELTQKEIALRVGYPDVYALSRMFKRRYGIAPGHFRSLHKKK